MAKKRAGFTGRSIAIAVVVAFVLGLLAAAATFSIMNQPDGPTDATSTPVGETTSSVTTPTATTTDMAASTSTAGADPTASGQAATSADADTSSSDDPADGQGGAAPLSSMAPATFLKQAAAMGEYTVYAPGWFPSGFKVDEGASSMKKGSSILILGKGDSRIALIQGAWDPGDTEPAAIDPAQWGTSPARPASLLIDVPYMTDRAPYRGRKDARMLIYQDSKGLNYAVVGVDVPVSDLRRIALSAKALGG